MTASVFSDWLAAIVEAVRRLELHEERQWRIGDNPVYVGRLEGLGRAPCCRGISFKPGAQRSLPDTSGGTKMANFRCRSATLRKSGKCTAHVIAKRKSETVILADGREDASSVWIREARNRDQFSG